METLPLELTYQILDGLSLTDVFSMMMVNLHYNDLVKNYLLCRLERPTHERSMVSEFLPTFSEQNQFDEVAYLLGLGANVHFYNDKSLRVAADKGHVNIVKILLDHGANVHFGADKALVDASYNGHTAVVQLLLDRGADPHNINAMFYSATYGNTEVMQLLLDHGADVNAYNAWALRLASEHNHPNLVNFLLKRGADVHAANEYALLMAIRNNNAEVAQILIDHGANIQTIIREVNNTDMIKKLTKKSQCTNQ